VSPWAGVLPTAPAPAARAPWTPDPAEIAALGAVGGRFLVQVRAEFDVDMIEGVLLLEAARTLDLLAAWRPLAATDPQAARLAIQYTRTFAALLGQVWRR
jgi:ACR3 family arsenite efflux pump ArsB